MPLSCLLLTLSLYLVITIMQQQQSVGSKHFNSRLSQLRLLSNKGYHSQLIICSDVPPSLKIPSLIACNMFDQAIVEHHKHKEAVNSPLNLLWFVMSSHMVGTAYEDELSKLSFMRVNEQYEEILGDWMKIAKPLSHATEVKTLLRNRFNELLQKSAEENYFRMKKMPIFLVATSWLQKLYDNSLPYIAAVDNTHLIQQMDHLTTDPRNMHLNYKIKADAKELTDFKIVSYEAWMFLKQEFGGVEIRRFITDEEQPYCEIWLEQVTVLIANGRHVIECEPITILASKLDTIASLVDRVKRMMIAYNMLGFEAVSKKWEVIRIRHSQPMDIVDLIHNEDQQLSRSYESINALEVLRLKYEHDLDEIEYCSNSDTLIMYVPYKKQIIDMDNIGVQKTVKMRPKCCTCESTEDLVQCSCRTVYFCAQRCRKTNKEHENKCSQLKKAEYKYNALMNTYLCKKRSSSLQQVRERKLGFENLGNTCYLNSALQCIMKADFLIDYVLRNQHLAQINIDNPLGTEGHTICAFGQFVKDYYETNRRAMDPIKILKAAARNIQFRGHSHQDAQQFLSYFLDKLHEDVNLIKDKPYVEDVESDGKHDDEISALSWLNYLKRNKSIISSNFTGQYRSEIRCPDCQRISITFDPFMSVTLPFPKPDKTFQMKAFYQSKYGEFQKIDRILPCAIPSRKFIAQFFFTEVEPLWLAKKRPNKSWKMNQSIYYNEQASGLLLFYEKPPNSQVQLCLSIEGYDIFHRRTYTPALHSRQQLLNSVYLNMKVPILKAIQKKQQKSAKEIITMSDEQYLSELCHKYDFIRLLKQPNEKEYPIKQGKFEVCVSIRAERLKQYNSQMDEKIKFDISSGAYKPKNQFRARSKNDELTVSSMLESFSEVEQLSKDNSWYCNKCKDHKLADKKMGLYRTPKFLILHLKRFLHSGNRYIIYGEKVKRSIAIQEYQTIHGIKYQLQGIVHHFGVLNAGHYTATVRKDGEWYYFDDSSVRKTKVHGGDSPYILFYKQVQQE